MALLVADAAFARFVSADPFEGKQSDPRTLHRYSYAHNDPLHGRDPTGQMTLAETGISLSALAGATLIVADHTLSANGGRPGLLQALLLHKTRHEIPDEAYDRMLRRHTLSQMFLLPPQEHHTIPMYLCGHPAQALSSLPFHQHTALHTGLASVKLFIEVKGAELERILAIPFGRRRKPIIEELGSTGSGREGIANAIYGLYTVAGALDWGAPSIGAIFPSERRAFARGHTSCVTND
jgi:hypothetical protein